MKTLIGLIAITFLVGCTTLPPKTEIVYVKVPVAVFPKPPTMPIRPVLTSADLLDETPVDQTVMAVVVDFERVAVYAQQLEELLQVYINDVATTAKGVEQQK